MNVNNNCGKKTQQTYMATEIAEILGVSLRTAYNLCERTKDFKVLRMGKRCLRVHKESFDKWFNSEQNTLP